VSSSQPAGEGRRDVCDMARLGGAASPDAVVVSVSVCKGAVGDWAVQLCGTRCDQIWRKGLDSDRLNNDERLRLLRRSK